MARSRRIVGGGPRSRGRHHARIAANRLARNRDVTRAALEALDEDGSVDGILARQRAHEAEAHPRAFIRPLYRRVIRDDGTAGYECEWCKGVV